MLAGSAAIARADGDPASDFLVARQVFVSSQSAALSSAQRELLGVVASANRAGFAVRVAVISSEYDMGSITALWRKPQTYARFLGLELAPGYRGRLLVVMPNGFGFNWPGHPSASADGLLARVRVVAGGDAMAQAARTAVTELAAADGVTLGASATPDDARPRIGGSWSVGLPVPPRSRSRSSSLALVLAAVRRRRERRPRAPAGSAESRAALPRKRWIVPAFASLSVVAIGVPIVALTAAAASELVGRRAGRVAGHAAAVLVAGGQSPAPGFVLRDQHGRPVSVAAFRGRPVIVTFVDPLCRNLCPLEAKVLNDVVGRMPAEQRPVILAVSVDVYADARADLLQDVRKWELVPQWRWAVGRPALLAAVWRSYKVGVRVTTKRIAGTTINYITHTEAAYIIDRTGHERALFLWPFYPQDVEHVLKELT